MPDAAPFLAAIRAAPDDDAPRLIYADWLDEHGEPERAEFIRVQCELARRESPGLKMRETDLLAKNHDAIAGPLKSRDIRFRFHRGFAVAFGHVGVFVLGRPGLYNQMIRFFPTGQAIFGQFRLSVIEAVIRFRSGGPGVISSEYVLDPLTSPAGIVIEGSNSVRNRRWGHLDREWLEVTDGFDSERYKLFPVPNVDSFQES
jgi:uncharacterized protein (TIGR02996 family)